MGEVRASDVVDAACEALVAGLDTPGLRSLAARPPLLTEPTDRTS
jgi:hypothetical protein